MAIPVEAPFKSMGYWTSYELLCTIVSGVELKVSHEQNLEFLSMDFVILECVRQKNFKSIYEEKVWQRFYQVRKESSDA
jgi:hypothetical protein